MHHVFFLSRSLSLSSVRTTRLRPAFVYSSNTLHSSAFGSSSQNFSSASAFFPSPLCS
jgi:hypothetical protein